MNEQNSVANENQVKRDFLKSLYSLRMNLSSVAKNLNGYGYKYQDFNEIIREIKSVIKSNNLDIDFVQYPTIKNFDGDLVKVITTTFYSPSSGYCESFDTTIYTEEFFSLGAKNQNILPQFIGLCMIYTRGYALVGYYQLRVKLTLMLVPWSVFKKLMKNKLVV
ncbi:ERF family protein [Borrelia puertoricensis]|uniref:ERF family protein n=1 Tax=Borrelia puertoricensis TaxID=2756107 RepID=UPI003D3158BA